MANSSCLKKISGSPVYMQERERVIFPSGIEERTEMADDQVLGILIIKLKDNFINIFVRLGVEVSVNSDKLYWFWISFYLVVFLCTGISFHKVKGHIYLDCIENFGMADSIGRFGMG